MGGTLRFGGVVQNLGPGIQFEQQKDPLPTDWRLGVAAVQMLDKKLNVSMDYSAPRRQWVYRRRRGVLDRSVPSLAHRLCEQQAMRVLASAPGIGLRISGVSFDYAYAGAGRIRNEPSL